MDKLKGEKKKVELEFQDRLAEVSNPALIENLADAVADAVAKRLRG